MEIRDAVEADLEALVFIYNASIPSRTATADLEPITTASRVQWFQEHSPHTYPLWVMTNQDMVIGWLGFQPFHRRAAYYPTAELSLYVHPDYHGQGIGKQLLKRAIATSSSLGFRNLVGLIFAHNYPSIRLFTNHQFEQWGYLPLVADLDNQERDLVIMGRRLPTN